MRLDKYVSNYGNYTRKESVVLIKKHRVFVNNVIIFDPGYKINPEQDEIKIDNQILIYEKFFYFALYKPKGYVCSNNNLDGESVINLLKEKNLNGIHISGRLDKDTTGLVILTNDGKFTHNIKNPKNNVEKEYEVQLEKIFTPEMKKQLDNEIIMDGKKIKSFKITNVKNKSLNITLTEGKYHQVKRIFQHVNNKVVELKRIRIGKLHLDKLNLKIGEYTKVNPSLLF